MLYYTYILHVYDFLLLNYLYRNTQVDRINVNLNIYYFIKLTHTSYVDSPLHSYFLHS